MATAIVSAWFFLASAGPLFAVIPTGDDLALARQWMDRSFEISESKLPGSFNLGDLPSLLEVTHVENETSHREPGKGSFRRIREFKVTNSELWVRLTLVTYDDFPALEWGLEFENRGNRDTPLLSDVWPADFKFQGRFGERFILHHADGSQAKPTDFQPRETELPPLATVTFEPEGGRSSDGVLPYFNLTKSDGGIVMAIGWTGQWRATFARDASHSVAIRMGQSETRLVLHPGEKIRTPSILVLLYKGDWLRGQNLLRQLILNHYTPRSGNRPVELPVAASGATIGFDRVTEANQKEALAHLVEKKLPVDTFWLDAGWSQGGFPHGMGTWDPDPIRFPHGLAPLGEAVHAAGLKFLAWFEPERVMPGTKLREEHPEWLLAPTDLPPELAYQADWRLFDLGNPRALEWAKARFSGEVKKAGIDIYRHDCNLHPLYYWRSGEPEDRKGMKEIRYIEGLYDYFETLAKDNPGLLLDNCASGGRRLDFEMMKRSVPLWRSDYCWDPVGAQNIQFALSLWLPLHGLGAVSADPYDFRSGMGANASYAFDYYDREAPFWSSLVAGIEEYRAIRPCFAGDYYPLTHYSDKGDEWMAWQYDRPDSGRGLVQAFRRNQAPLESIRLVLQGLEVGSDYRVSNRDTAISTVFGGEQLMTQGIEIRLANRPASALLTYERISR